MKTLPVFIFFIFAAVVFTARCRCALMSSPLTMGTSAQIPYARKRLNIKVSHLVQWRYRHRHRPFANLAFLARH